MQFFHTYKSALRSIYDRYADRVHGGVMTTKGFFTFAVDYKITPQIFHRRDIEHVIDTACRSSVYIYYVYLYAHTHQHTCI